MGLRPHFFYINNSMTELNALARQPETIDYSAPSQYRFSILQLPKVQFFTTACNIPGISMGEAVYATPYKNINVLPDKITFDNLEITFLVDEKLENYQELHNWITAIGFPEDRAEFKAFRKANSDRRPDSISKYDAKSDSPKPRTPDSAMYSDATLTILTNKNNPILNVLFSNVYPVSLSGLNYTNDASDTQYLSAQATFQYQLYKFQSLG
tara:strand:- start:163 stop:795 length:633 start_codon:yes stop_codon:yes gene_type:complete